jgi:hypothetical protein
MESTKLEFTSRSNQESQPDSAEGIDRCLNLWALQPGDVILTFPKRAGWESHLITFVCGGPFSHAILVMNKWMWYESEDNGVGPTIISIDRIELNNKARVLKMINPNWRRIAVYRHSELLKISEDERFERISKIVEKYSFKQYPHYERVVADLNLWPIVPFRRWLASLFDGDSDLNRGMFCSEVVAQVYKDLGHPFTRSPSSIRPSDICNREVSHLERIDDVFCYLEHDSHSVRPGFLEMVNLPDRISSRQALTGLLTNVKTLGEGLVEAAFAWIECQDKNVLCKLVAPQVAVDLLRAFDEFCEAWMQNALIACTAINEYSENGVSFLQIAVGNIKELTLFSTLFQELTLLTEVFCRVSKRDPSISLEWRAVLVDRFERSSRQCQAHLKLGGTILEVFTARETISDEALDRATSEYKECHQKIVQEVSEAATCIEFCLSRIQELPVAQITTSMRTS